jgi:hypothetical protein
LFMPLLISMHFFIHTQGHCHNGCFICFKFLFVEPIELITELSNNSYLINL